MSTTGRDDTAREVRDWLAGSWSPELTLGEWWRRAAEAGWAFPTWPVGHGGRDLSPGDARSVGQAFSEAGAVAPPGGLGQMMGGPVVTEHGTEEQKDRWLMPLASGLESWCQLFSEPGAGSDLASLQTRAVRDGDVWVVNGQKVWTSGARTADPVFRQRLASMRSLAEAHRVSGLRARAASQAGRVPGPEVSTGKLVTSELGRRARDISLEVQGPFGMLLGDDAPDGGRFQQMALRVQSGSIAGGTDQIQRNIIGERVLGLPREPQVDRDVPFRDLRVGTQRPGPEGKEAG